VRVRAEKGTEKTEILGRGLKGPKRSFKEGEMRTQFVLSGLGESPFAKKTKGPRSGGFKVIKRGR